MKKILPEILIYKGWDIVEYLELQLSEWSYAHENNPSVSILFWEH